MTGSALFSTVPGGRPRREVVPGAVHVPSWLTIEEQRWIAGRFEEWARGPVPIRAAKVRGHEMSVRTVCLGWHWQPYKYTREATDVNGSRVLPFPEWMVRLGRRALAAAAGDSNAGDAYTPDTAGCGLPEGRINVTMRVTGLA
jgi:alkylated DNA repair protein (DNA oxidative demethylase)